MKTKSFVGHRNRNISPEASQASEWLTGRSVSIARSRVTLVWFSLSFSFLIHLLIIPCLGPLFRLSDRRSVINVARIKCAWACGRGRLGDVFAFVPHITPRFTLAPRIFRLLATMPSIVFLSL